MRRRSLDAEKPRGSVEPDCDGAGVLTCAYPPPAAVPGLASKGVHAKGAIDVQGLPRNELADLITQMNEQMLAAARVNPELGEDFDRWPLAAAGGKMIAPPLPRRPRSSATWRLRQMQV